MPSMEIRFNAFVDPLFKEIDKHAVKSPFFREKVIQLMNRDKLIKTIADDRLNMFAYLTDEALELLYQEKGV